MIKELSIQIEGVDIDVTVEYEPAVVTNQYYDPSSLTLIEVYVYNLIELFDYFATKDDILNAIRDEVSKKL